MTSAPYSWLKSVEDALEEIKEIPLWGSPPPFPWQDLSDYLSQLLQEKDVKITSHRTEFRSSDELLSGMGSRPQLSVIELTPLSGAVYWALPSEEIAKLIHACFPEPKQKGFSDLRLQEGFYRYFLLEVIHALNVMQAIDDLPIKMVESVPLPKEGALCIDISIAIDKDTIWGRIICPSSFHLAYKTHFIQKRPSLLKSSKAQEIEVPLSLQIAKETLHVNEWKKVKVGDFLPFPKASFDPKEKKGTLELVLGKTPLFHGKLKEGHLKILDYAFYHEEETAMAKEYDEGFEELPEDENPETENPDELFSDDEIQDMDKSTEWEEEGTPKDEEEVSHVSPPIEEKLEPLEELISSKEIPLTLVVQAGKMRISLEKLLQLEPGNVLELPVKPEQGVDLTVNGKAVARGELIKIGDTLGVRVLEIG